MYFDCWMCMWFLQPKTGILKSCICITALFFSCQRSLFPRISTISSHEDQNRVLLVLVSVFVPLSPRIAHQITPRREISSSNRCLVALVTDFQEVDWFSSAFSFIGFDCLAMIRREFLSWSWVAGFIDSPLVEKEIVLELIWR